MTWLQAYWWFVVGGLTTAILIHVLSDNHQPKH